MNVHRRSCAHGLLICMFFGRALGKLEQVDTVAVGHVREIKDSPGGRPKEIRTLSLDPPVFLVPEFLSESEADELIALAEPNKTKLWEYSQVGGGAHELRAILRKGGKSAMKRLSFFDRDGDKKFDSREIYQIAREFFNLPNFENRHHLAFVSHVYPDANGPAGDMILIKDFLKSDVFGFFQKLDEKEPELKERYSNQRWLSYNKPLLKTLRGRAQTVSGFPDFVMDQSEQLQVVHYPLHGHYACHHDSSPDSIDEGDIRLATIGVFLNDPDKGGELAFPAADRPETKSWSMNDFSNWEGKCQPTPQCTAMGGLVVKPKKGDAVFWYNSKASGWNAPKAEKKKRGFGDRTLIWSSMHCGAEVLAGEKWFANLWFRTTKLRSEL